MLDLRFDISYLRWPWLAAILLALTGCEPSASRSYGLTLFDASGNQVASGVLTLSDDAEEPGFYYLTPASDLSKTAAETRTALRILEDEPLPIAMRKVDDEVRINLHPGVDDSNIWLIGAWKNGTLEGKWEYHSYAGVAELGTFKAVPVAQASAAKSQEKPRVNVSGHRSHGY